MMTDYNDVYKIFKQLKDCRCSISFVNALKPDKKRKYSFFISEVLYKQSLKDLISHISRKIDPEGGKRPIADISKNMKHLYEIVEKEENKEANKPKDYVEYGEDGKSLNVTIKLTPTQALDRYFAEPHRLYIAKDECYDLATDSYHEYTEKELDDKFPNF